MRLLPYHSRRGRWLFAGVLWLAACAGLWTAMPVVPRGTLRLPRDFDLVCVLPGGGRAVIAKQIRDGFGYAELVNFELIDLPSGRSLEKLANCSTSHGLLTRWKNCGSVPVRAGPKDDEKWCLLNLREFAVKQLGTDQSDLSHWASEPSTDGRFGVTWIEGNEARIQVWDLQTNRLQGTLPVPDLYLPYHFAIGKTLLAAISRSEPNKISLIELKSLSTLATLDGPEKMRAIMACFSDDERFLVAAFEDDDGEKNHFPPFRLVCWNLSIGLIESRVCDLRYEPGVISPPAGGLVVTQHYSGHPPLHCTAVEQPWNLDLSPCSETHCELSPDKRILFVRTIRYGTFVGDLLYRVGITWRVPTAMSITGQFYDVASGALLGDLQVWNVEHASDDLHFPMDAEWSPTCETLAIFQSGSNNWDIWDIPPRKSLLWFAASAALLAFPIALVAWRRTRKLRAT